MKPDNLDRHEQVLRTAGSLRWETVLLIATLGATLGTGRGWAGDNVWTSIGPFGGSARALAIDSQNPGTVYVGTSGGVFRTTNGGANWSGANSGLPAGYLAHSLVIDPQSPNTAYAGGACGTYDSGETVRG